MKRRIDMCCCSCFLTSMMGLGLEVQGSPHCLTRVVYSYVQEVILSNVVDVGFPLHALLYNRRRWVCRDGDGVSVIGVLLVRQGSTSLPLICAACISHGDLSVCPALKCMILPLNSVPSTCSLKGVTDAWVTCWHVKATCLDVVHVWPCHGVHQP
jgi:hypothetical protein